MEDIIAVNEQDEVQGFLEKMYAHEKGVLHRAISVFVINSKGEWLLQQRARDKYHSALQWSNACCTHPGKGESTIEAAYRRLKEEMGFTTSLTHLLTFQYRAELDNGLIEHELDHVFIGESNVSPIINESEVAAYRYVSKSDIEKEIRANPGTYTAWFLLLFDKVANKLDN